MDTEKFSLGISPCPNDTFMFYQLLHSHVATNIKLHMADVEELNCMCLQEKLDFSKVSFHVLGKLRKHYCLLSAGSALGRGCGPLIVSKTQLDSLEGRTIAIPGMNTTALLLLKCYAPDNIILKEMLFSDIMPAIVNGEVDAGLIIHESRFTYKNHGLQLIADLGAWWEDFSGLPIPLGGIIASRKLPLRKIKDFEEKLRDSVKSMLDKNWQESPELIEFITEHSQEIDPHVLKAHIDTYVNKESVNLSQEGRQAIKKLFAVAEERGFIETCQLPLFAGDL